MGVGNLFCQVPQPPDPGSELVSELVIRCSGLTGTTCVPDILSLVAIVTMTVRSMSRRAWRSTKNRAPNAVTIIYFRRSKIKELATPVCLKLYFFISGKL